MTGGETKMAEQISKFWVLYVARSSGQAVGVYVLAQLLHNLHYPSKSSKPLPNDLP